MQNDTDLSPAELRAEVSPVSERFAAFEFGEALVVYDEDNPDGWVMSDTTCERDSMC